MKLQDAVDEVLATSPSITNTQLARQVLELIDKEQLLPLLVDHLRHTLRARTRAAERQAFEDFRSRHTPDRTPLPESRPIVNRAVFDKLRNARFALGDGTTVNWLSATVDQHRQRIAMLRKSIAGQQETVEFHEESIRFCEQTNTATVADALEASAAVAA